MEIGELRARRGLFSATERDAHERSHPRAESWDVGGVSSFLVDAGLGQFAPSFAAARIDGAALLRLSDAQLATLAGAPSADDTWEAGLAAQEQLSALVAHLRWRSRGGAPKGKEEL